MAHSLLDRVAANANPTRHSIINNKGQIDFERSIVMTYALGDAVGRLHDLHLQVYRDSKAMRLPQVIVDPKGAYRVAATALIMTFGTLDNPDDASFAMEKLLDAGERLGRTGGLESPFATLLLRLGGNEARLGAALGRWQGLELDGRSGGGADFELAFDGDTGSFSRFKTGSLHSVDPGATSRLAASVRGAMEQYPMSERECTTAITAGAALLGAFVGRAVGGRSGAMALSTAMREAGEVAAGVVCPPENASQERERSEDTTSPTSIPSATTPAPPSAVEPNQTSPSATNSGASETPSTPTPEPATQNDGELIDDKPLTEATKGTGCIPVGWQDFRQPDAYSSFALRRTEMLLPTGRGLAQFALIKDSVRSIGTLQALDRTIVASDVKVLSDSSPASLLSHIDDRSPWSRAPRIEDPTLSAPVSEAESLIHFNEGSLGKALYPEGLLANRSDPRLRILERLTTEMAPRG